MTERRTEAERREEMLSAAFHVAVRDTLGRLSVRAVAEAAGVSKGLVFFYFEDRQTLLLALLDWVLERGPRIEVPADLEEEGAGPPARRLLRLLEHQVAGLPERRDRVGLFLDFWVMGTGMPEFRSRIRAAFDRYRAEFVPYTRPVVESLPDRFEDGTPEGLAAVVVSFIQGCALQLLSAPAEFDVERYMGAVRGLVRE